MANITIETKIKTEHVEYATPALIEFAGLPEDATVADVELYFSDRLEGNLRWIIDAYYEKKLADEAEPVAPLDLFE